MGFWMNIEFVQQQYVADRAHRDRFGQFFTPPFVADFMVRWVLAGGSAELFDPAVGAGAFQAAALERRDGIRLVGCEKDPVIRSFFLGTEAGSRTSLIGSDYFDVGSQEFCAIVCNPPYLKFQNFEGRHSVVDAMSALHGLRFSGYLNAASAFLLKAVADLKEGGRLAFLMPLEFLGAGYGKAVKQVLLDCSTYLHFVRVVDEKGVFPDVITSVGMLFLERGAGTSEVRFSEIDDPIQFEGRLDELRTIDVDRASLVPGAKWHKWFAAREVEFNAGLVPLNTYGRFTRGIATGANDFFVLRRSDCEKLALPANVRVPCISRSSQVVGRVFEQANMDDLVDADEPVFLLDLMGAEHEPRVREYIRAGEQRGYSERYLTRQRHPWYKVESRLPPYLLFGVFSRGKYKVIRNTCSALTLTPFHGFYPDLLGSRFGDHLWIFLSSKAGSRALQQEMRRYGGKLDKFEPNDLNRVLVPSPDRFSSLAAHLLTEATSAMAGGRELPLRVEQAMEQMVAVGEGGGGAVGSNVRPTRRAAI
ncbi:MAG TPA: N-6 DNA methylase [Rhodanobacteraceae bacterium]